MQTEHKEWNFTKEKSRIIKCLAIVFVILSHCGLMECGGAIGVDLFLIVSGFGLYYSYKNNGEKNFWFKRINAVYLPYLFCTVIFMPLHLFLVKDLDFKSIFITLLGLDFGLNVDPTMWYISYIFSMYVIAWVYFKICNKYKLLRYFFVAGTVFIITICGYKHYVWHAGTIAWAYGLSFPIGFFLAEREKIVKKVIHPITLLLLFFSLVLVFVPHETYIKLIFPLTISLFLFLLIGFCDINQSIINKLILFCGKYSFFHLSKRGTDYKSSKNIYN